MTQDALHKRCNTVPPKVKIISPNAWAAMASRGRGPWPFVSSVFQVEVCATFRPKATVKSTRRAKILSGACIDIGRVPEIVFFFWSVFKELALCVYCLGLCMWVVVCQIVDRGCSVRRWLSVELLVVEFLNDCCFVFSIFFRLTFCTWIFRKETPSAAIWIRIKGPIVLQNRLWQSAIG